MVNYYFGTREISVMRVVSIKIFYYAHINELAYTTSHKMTLEKMEFVDYSEDEKYNNYIFEVLAKDFYRQFEISEDSKGSRPY